METGESRRLFLYSSIILVLLIKVCVDGAPFPVRATDSPKAAWHASAAAFQATTTTEPEMVPVSSTVITVVNHRPPAARQSSTNYYYSRRFRFYDKSSKPDEPLKLITKGTSLKAYFEPSSVSSTAN